MALKNIVFFKTIYAFILIDYKDLCQLRLTFDHIQCQLEHVRVNEPWEYKQLQIQILYFYHHGYSGEDIFLHLFCYFNRDEIADYYEVAFSKGKVVFVYME